MNRALSSFFIRLFTRFLHPFKKAIVYGCILLLCAFLLHINEKYRKIKRRHAQTSSSLLQFEKGLLYTHPMLGNLALPEHLRKVSALKSQEMIVHVNTLAIRNVVAPKSPCLIKHGTGYLLFFQYDVPFVDAAPQ